jgi:hypothetical protein
MDLAKDEGLLSILRRLRRDLGEDAFVIEDHWEADLNAIGIARPDDRRFLVYITIQPQVPSLSFQCESPSVDADLPYHSDDMTDGVTYEQLVGAARHHLLGE